MVELFKNQNKRQINHGFRETKIAKFQTEVVETPDVPADTIIDELNERLEELEFSATYNFKTLPINYKQKIPGSVNFQKVP